MNLRIKLEQINKKCVFGIFFRKLKLKPKNATIAINCKTSTFSLIQCETEWMAFSFATKNNMTVRCVCIRKCCDAKNCCNLVEINGLYAEHWMILWPLMDERTAKMERDRKCVLLCCVCLYVCVGLYAFSREKERKIGNIDFFRDKII